MTAASRAGPPPVTGVVLAGGRSTRFGRDKLLERVEGVPLLHHAVLRVAEVAGEVILTIAPGGPEPALPPGIVARVVRDPAEGEGPLVGLLTGLEAAPGERVLVAAGDMPDLATPVLLELLRVLDEAAVDGVVLADPAGGERGYRPLPAALRTEPAASAAHALLHRGERSLYALTGALRLAVIDEPTWRALDPSGGTLRDVDRPQDLAAPPEGS